MIKVSNMQQKGLRNSFFNILLVLAVTFLMLIIFVFVYIDKQNNQLQQERDSITKKAELVDSLHEQFNNIFFRARGYYAFQNEKELNELYASMNKFKTLLEQFSQLSLSNEEKKLYTDLSNFHKNYQDHILPTAISYVKANDYASLRNLSNSGANELINNFMVYTQSYKKETDEELNNIFIRSVEQGKKFTFFTLLLSGFIFILMSLILRRVLFNLIRPIEQLTHATDALASGQLFELENLIVRNDEFGTLSSSFRKMAQSIQEKEEMMATQNEELLAQQDELQENQTHLQNSLDQLEKYNQLNHVFTFTLDKQLLIQNLHDYLNTIYKFDTSVLYWFEGDVYSTKGLSSNSTATFIKNLDTDKQQRLAEEQYFVITRQVMPSTQSIIQQPYNCYDLYCSILNKEKQLAAVLITTREGYPYSPQEIANINGLLKRVSIAFERILMYEEIERSRQLNQNIIDNVNEGIQFVSTTGDIILINTALLKMIQYTTSIDEQPIPKQTWLQHFQHKCHYFDDLLIFFESAITDSFQDTRTLRYSFSPETAIFIEVYATCIFDNNEKVGTIFVHRDITREYEIDQMKSDLVSTVSHELRTPLSSVLGFTELLLTKNLKPERQHKYIETIHKEAIRLTNLINDFLDLQRMESGKQQYNIQTLSVNEVAFNVIRQFSHEKQHNIHLIDRAKDIRVKADTDKLAQVFVNLISNAIKFSPDGGNITITLENIHHTIQVSIADQGMGIPKKDIPHLFQKFKRIDISARRKIGGTGLGLAICKEIILKHNGDIWINSEEGQGTTVYFTLPLENPTVYLKQYDTTVNFAHMEKGLNVMIVEDDASLALLLSEELKSKGFTVIHHTNPKQALKDILQIPLIGIVIDLMLGDEMNGWDLIEQLKENKQTENIPIVISSALDAINEKIEKFHIQKYLTKPYPPEELSKILVTFLLSEESNGNIIFPKQSL